MRLDSGRNAMLALCAVPPDDDRVEEVLRYLVGLVAAGRGVTWLAVAGGRACAGDEPEWTAEAESYVEALREAGIEAQAATVRDVVGAFASHDGLLVASPEYNSSITPLLKNVIDWVSRKTVPDEPMLAAQRGARGVGLAVQHGKSHT